MIPLETAVERLRALVGTGQPAPTALEDALGLHLAEALVAGVDLPGFDHSAMDGYAVRAEDASVPSRWLPVVGEQPAGIDRRLSVEAGQAVRIFTGAPIPDGADAVVMQEDCEVREGEVRILDPPQPGEFIRRRGGDLCAGQRLADAGTQIDPALIGVVASQGLDQVAAIAPPRVAVVSTGDELVPPGTELEPGQLHDSNRPMIASCVRGLGATVIGSIHVGDSLDETLQALETSAGGADFVLVSGGVSVGDHDQVRPALEYLGFAFDFWKVAIMPGKPFLAARRPGGGAVVFGLPGNPVSSFVTFHLLVAPALRSWMGSARPQPTELSAEVAEALSNEGNRRHYLRGRLDLDGTFTTTGLQQSHALAALSRANALLPLEPGEQVRGGEHRRVILIGRDF